MKYKSIEEANVSDAVRHLKAAQATGDYQKITIANRYLQQQLDLIKEAKPEIHKKYLNELFQPKI